PTDERLALHRELAVDVAPRVVPRPGQPAALPQPHDGVAVGRLEGPDAPRHRRRLAPATAPAGTPSSHLPTELAPRTVRARPGGRSAQAAGVGAVGVGARSARCTTTSSRTMRHHRNSAKPPKTNHSTA